MHVFIRLPLCSLASLRGCSLAINKYCLTLFLKRGVLKRLKSGVSSCQRSTAIADIVCLPVFVLQHVLYRFSFEAYLVL